MSRVACQYGLELDVETEPDAEDPYISIGLPADIGGLWLSRPQVRALIRALQDAEARSASVATASTEARR